MSEQQHPTATSTKRTLGSLQPSQSPSMPEPGPLHSKIACWFFYGATQSGLDNVLLETSVYQSLYAFWIALPAVNCAFVSLHS